MSDYQLDLLLVNLYIILGVVWSPWFLLGALFFLGAFVYEVAHL